MPTNTVKTYSTEEIAKRLGCHVNSIRRNLRRGQLEGEKWSNEWIVTDDALREWLPAPIYQEAFGSAKTEHEA
jgi:excisionase family DNA binding protein